MATGTTWSATDPTWGTALTKTPYGWLNGDGLEAEATGFGDFFYTQGTLINTN